MTADDIVEQASLETSSADVRFGRTDGDDDCSTASVVRPFLLRLEKKYLCERRAWDAAFVGEGEKSRWELEDKFEGRLASTPCKDAPRAGRARGAKAITNGAVAASAAMVSSPGVGWAMVLDGEDAATSVALLEQGFRPERIFSPNVCPPVVAALRGLGILSWAGRIEHFLDAVAEGGGGAESLPALDLVYLDHTGAFPSRAGQLRTALQTRGLLAPGGVLACTFSTREGAPESRGAESEGLPPGWSQAHAIYVLARVLVEAASVANVRLEGVEQDGLVDYQLSVAGAAAVDAPEVGSIDLLRAALAAADAPALARALLAWGEANAGGGEAPDAPRRRLAGLALQATAAARRAGAGASLPGRRPAPQQLGAAWPVAREGPRDGDHRKPRAVLTSDGPMADSDVVALWAAARKVIAAAGSDRSATRGGPPRAGMDAERGGQDVQKLASGVMLRRCLLLYPEQMMFVAVKVWPLPLTHGCMPPRPALCSAPPPPQPSVCQ